jgi:hypothetical protein
MMRLLILIAMLCVTGKSFAGCTGKIVSVTAQSPLTYSSFAAWNAQQIFNLTVQNSGAVACSYQVSIPPGFYPLQFGGKLSFNLSASAGVASASPNFTITTPAVKPGQSAQLPIILTVPRGQPSLSGSFTSKIGFALAAAGTLATQPPIDQVIVPLACTVPPIFEINVAGSGSRSTVQFASLEAGQKASVVLQTRTNGDYRIVFRSLNSGLLTLAGRSGPASAIAYAAAVDGHPVALTAPVALSYASEPGEGTRRLTVTVGDTSGKLAGTYTDVITVSILSSM